MKVDLAVTQRGKAAELYPHPDRSHFNEDNHDDDEYCDQDDDEHCDNDADSTDHDDWR